MKSFFRTIFFAVSVLLLTATPVLAKNITPPHVVTLEKNTVVNHDYFAAGDSVVLSGTVNGDAYIAGGTITIDGTVTGDLMAVGGTLNISGKVLHDLRVAGGTVIVSSPVSGNITVAGGNVTFSKDARVAGSVVAGAGSLEIQGPVGRGMTLGAGSLIVGNKVTGDITAGVGTFTMLPEATVTGNVTYWSKADATLASGATVSGVMLRHEPPAEMKQDVPALTPDFAKKASGMFAGMFIAWKAISFVLHFVFGLLIFSLLPAFSKKVVDTFHRQPLADMGIGLATVIGLPIVAVILLVTVIGIPVGVFLFTALGLVFFLAQLYAGLAVGTRITAWIHAESGRVLTYLIGLTALLLLSLLPILGGFVSWLVQIMVVGALMKEKYALYSHLRTKRIL